MPRSHQCRGWAFTQYEKIDKYHERWKTCGFVQWMIYGREVCPTTGRPHLQGALYSASKLTMQQIKDGLNSQTIHLEPWYAGADANARYCSKDADDVVEYGKRPRQGARTDLQKIKEICEEKKSMRAVIDEATSYQQLQVAKVIFTYIRPPTRDNMEVHWYYGPTGTGKSHTAHMEAGEDAYVCNATNQWWDGYDGHKTVIIDDYRRDFCKFHELLRLFDKYPLRVPIKGAYLPLCMERIYITSPLHPRSTWEGRTEEDIQQLLRRITFILHFSDRYTATVRDGDDMGEAAAGAFPPVSEYLEWCGDAN